MTQHIGIVACSAEGASLCYRTICVEGAALLGAHAHPEVSMHTPSLADYMARHLPRRLAARGRADAGIGGQARQGRRRFPDLPRQHHPSGPAPCPAALAAALAAHRRGGRGGGGRARLSPHRHHGHALAGRQRGLSGEAFGARPGVSPPEPGRARGVQPHHHGRAGLQHLQAGVDRLLPAGHRSPEGPGLRCRRAGLHRDPADHRRCELAPAHPRFDAPAGASGAPSRRARRNRSQPSRPNPPPAVPARRRRRPSRARRTRAACAPPRVSRRSRACCAPAASRG